MAIAIELAEVLAYAAGSVTLEEENARPPYNTVRVGAVTLEDENTPTRSMEVKTGTSED